MTCESVISAIAAGKIARVLGQKVDDLGCPVRTRDVEDGGDTGRIEHDAMCGQSGGQRRLEFLDVDLPGDAIVHSGLSSGDPGWGCVAWGRAERAWLRVLGAG